MINGRHRGLACSAVFALAISIAAQCPAWNDTGHMLTAMRAWDSMTPQARTWAMQLLRAHPRYAIDLGGKIPKTLEGADRDRWLFAYAATWPDQVWKIRTFAPRDFYTYFHSTWHVIGLSIHLQDPLDQSLEDVSFAKTAILHPTTGPVSTQPAPLNAREALKQNIAELNDPSASESQRSVAFCWVMHLVGDIHQPCHTASLICRRFPASDGDHVGTRLPVMTSKGKTAMHQLWDHAMGDSEDLPTLQQLDAEMLADPKLQPDALAQLKRDTTVDQWIAESHLDAERFVYTPEVRAAIAAQDGSPTVPFHPVVISDEYIRAMRALVAQRISLGGMRLGSLWRTPLTAMGLCRLKAINNSLNRF